MKKLASVVLALSMAAGLAAATNVYAGEKQKVVYHVNGDDPKQQKAALGNIQNHINAIGKDNLDLRVVMHGDGLSLILVPEGVAGSKMKAGNATDEMAARIDTLKGQGISFKVCNNTIKGRQIDKANLYGMEVADIVPSALAVVAILPSQGFAYIKP